MKLWCLFAAATALDVSQIDPHFRDPASQDLSAEAERKFQELSAKTITCDAATMLYNATGCGVIEIETGEQYVDYVMTAPRKYDLFVLFVVKRGHCCAGRIGGSCRKQVCSNAEDAFHGAAASYFAKGQRPPSDGDPTFFAIVRCDKESLRPICNEVHKFDVIPKLVHARSKSFTRRQGVFRFRQGNMFSESKSAWPHNELLNWVNDITGRGVREQVDVFKMVTRMLPLFAILVGGLALLFVGAQIVRQLPWVMTIGALGIQWLGCSGLTYNIINGVWWATGDNFFMNSMRSQYLGEGLLCSGMMCGAGLCFVLAAWLNSIEFRENDKRAQQKIAAANFLSLTALITGACLVQALMKIYSSFKAGWYRNTPFMPPDDYEVGPLMADRQLSFINYQTVPWFQSHPVISTTAAFVFASKNLVFGSFYKFIAKARKLGRDLNDSPLRIIRVTYVTLFDKVFDVVEVVVSPFVNIGGKKKKSKKSR